MTWGDAAFARAKAENKPVFVNVGTFTSELGRAMRDQSFAREENAAMLNDNFVCILVDRDDRPDVAAFYQAYLNVVKQTQGSPYNLWLTPELLPFEGASYLPPSDEWGKEGFTNALKRVLAAWQADPEAQRRKGEEAIARLAATAEDAPAVADAAYTRELVDDSAAAVHSTYDEANGGFGEAPKHPDPELLRFLLRAGDGNRDAALATLRKIAGSAVRDPLDGGFFRYATDAEWKLPYFQKSLADQARIALAYLDAAKMSGDALLADAARDALKYALTLGDAQRGFAAAEDGTMENILPSFLWTGSEIESVLGKDRIGAAFTAFGVKESGNIAPDAYLGIDGTGKNVLHPAAPWNAQTGAEWSAAAAKLLTARRTRPQPLRDDVATSGAHGLFLSALARAGQQTSDTMLTAAAKDVFVFVRDQLRTDDGALRARPGRATPASPRDYAVVIDGLLTHAAAGGDAAARELALGLLEKLMSTYTTGPDGRFFITGPEPVPGLGARVILGGPEGRDLPGSKEAMLLTLVQHDVGTAELRNAFAAGIVADIENSPNQPRGDQLLALQAALSAK